MWGREPSLALTGRDHDLAAFAEVWQTVRQRGPAALLVSGDAGIGKTRLAQELATRAGAEDAVVLVGRAIDLGEDPPCWPVTSALRDFLRPADRQWARDLLTPWIPELTDLLLPLGATRDAPMRNERSRFDMLELVYRVLAELSAHAPVLLVVEDLQWAGRSTCDMLVYLLANFTDEPVLVLGTYQNEAVRPDHPLRRVLSELRRERRVFFHEIQPLTRQAVASLVASAVPHDPALVDLVWHRSAGNAFIVEETLRSAQEGDAGDVPFTLRDLVLSRFHNLPHASQRVARALAVGDAPVAHRLLAEIMELPEPELLIALRAAADAAVVVVDPLDEGYALRHGLMKDVISADLLPGERIALHGRYGEALERLADSRDPAVALRLAFHWYLAGDAERAFPAAVAAAEAAERMRGFDEAHRQWMRALDLLDRMPYAPVGIARAELLERAAEAAHLAGEHDDAVALLQVRLEDAAAMTGLQTALRTERLGRYLLAAGHSRAAVEVYRQAAALLPGEAALRERASVIGAFAEALRRTGSFDESRVQAQRALALAERAVALPEQGQVLATLGFSLAYLEDADAGVAALHESLRIAEQTETPTEIAQAHQNLAELLSGPLNELAEGVEVALSGVDRVTDLGLSRTFGVRLLAMAANGLFRLGRWDEAEATVDQAWALRPSGAEALDVRLARCRLLIGRGDFEPAQDDLAAIDTLSMTTVGPRYRVPLFTLRAGLEMFQGRPDLARQLVLQGLDIPHASDDIWLLSPLVWHGLRAEAEIAASPSGRPYDDGTIARLRRHMHELAAQAAQAVPAVQASVTAFLELCRAEESRASGRQDPDAWARCVDAWERLCHPYPAAYARLRQAEALLAHKSRSAAATEALVSAWQTARKLRAYPFLREIEDLASRARVLLEESDAMLPAATPDARHLSTSTPRAAPPPPELADLTPRELEVLTELSKGLTNREIAERLFISEKTVGVHVTHILAKTGARTRVHASAILHRTRTAQPGQELSEVVTDAPPRRSEIERGSRDQRNGKHQTDRRRGQQDTQDRGGGGESTHLHSPTRFGHRTA